MKKFLLLLIVFMIGAFEVNAYDIESSFYYDDEKVSGMWITREKDSVTKSGLPFFLKRRGDNKIVYCLEPFVMLQKEEKYEGYYQTNNYFNLSEEKLERIRLLAFFGYMYPGHEDDKWYGITQYLIWKTVQDDADIYFVDVRYGNKIEAYTEEIREIEMLISEYKELIKLDGQVLRYDNIDEFYALKKSNYFLKDIDATNNTIVIPVNVEMKEQEIFYYHKESQKLYLPGVSFARNINFEVALTKNVKIKKWYGSGKYKEEAGAVFEVCEIDGQCHRAETDKNGEATINLDYGTYSIKQIKGKKGYSFIEETILEVNANSSTTLELYNEAITVAVPDTYKGNFITDLIMRIRWYVYDFKIR